MSSKYAVVVNDGNAYSVAVVDDGYSLTMATINYTITISNSAGGGAVDSVNGKTGVIDLSTDDIDEGVENLYFADAYVSSNSDVTANTTHRGKTDNPHSVTKAQIGLSDVPNTDATDRANHTGTQAASTISDFDTVVSANIDVDANKAKLAGIEAGARADQTGTEIVDAIDTELGNSDWQSGGGGGAVDSVNTQTGAVVLDSDDIAEGSSNLYYTEARVNANSNVVANTAHLSDTGNPHDVNKTDVGLSNVANVDTSNADNISSGALADARIPSSITRDSELGAVATSNDYDELDNKPSIPSQLSDFSDVNTAAPTNRHGLFGDGVDFESRAIQDADLPSTITRDSELAEVATSGDYSDLSNKPTIPSGSDDISNESSVTGASASDALETLNTGLSGKADTSHSHTLVDITDSGALAALDAVDTNEIADEAITADKLADTTVTPGSYTNLNATIDQQGRIITASNGSGGGGGAGQLSDLSDVGDATATNRNAMMGDGDSWESRPLEDADLPSSITRDSELATIATTGDYDDLSNKPTIPSVPVDSVHGRTGAVVAATSDYDASQIDNDSGVGGATVAAALNTIDADKASISHTLSHVRGGSDELDGDTVDIDVTLTNITPDITPAEVSNPNELGAIVKGIDNELGSLDSGKTDIGHGHVAADVTDFDTEVGNHPDVTANTAHLSDTDNPHGVDKTDVGLGNVPNVDTSNAGNITSGTLSDARIPSGITRDSELATVAISGDYDDLTNKPSVPSQLTDLGDVNTATPTNRHGLFGDGVDWESRAIQDSDVPASITRDSELGAVATSNSYDDLDDKPTIPTVPVDSVNTQTGAVVLDKTDIGLSNVANIDTTNASNINSGTLADARLSSNVTLDSELGVVATSNDYNDLDNKPAIPTVPVDSVHGRTGAVVATVSDYDASQIDNDSSVSGATLDLALDALETAIGTKANTSHTHPASEVTDFDTEVSNNTSVAANTTHRGLTNNPHGVDKVDVGLSNVPNTDATNASNISSGTLPDARLSSNVTMDTDLSPIATSGDYDDLSNKPSIPSELSDLSDVGTATPTNRHVLIGDGVDFDTRALVEADIPSLPLSKISDSGDLAAQDNVNNADWSGTDLSVTNGGTGASDASVARTNLGAQETLSGATLTSVTVAATDKVLVQDDSDSSNLKTVTAQSIADLASGGGGGSANMSVLTLRESGGKDMNAASTNNVMPWDIQDNVDTDSFGHDTVTNNSRITLKQAGHYLVTCSINVANSATSNFRYNGRVKTRINGSTTLDATSQTGYIRNSSGQDETSLTFSLILTDVSANDYIEILVDAESTTSGAATTIADTSHISILYLAGAGTVASAGYDSVENDGAEVTARSTLNFEHPLTAADVSSETLISLGNGAIINIAETVGLVPVNGSYEDIPFNVENINSDTTRIDFTTSGADITFLKAGLYEVVIASLISGASGVGSMRLRRSTNGGASYTTHASAVTYSVNSNTTPINSWVIEVVADEQIKFEIQENSGTLNLLYSEATAKRH